MEKYDRIGVGYNLTRKADPYLTDRFLHHLSPAEQGGLYLDIGCGTGNYTIALHRKGLDFTGIDPSREMLEVAKAKNDGVRWLTGRAEAIPLDDHCVDGVVACLTIHHWPDMEKGFEELKRVLKPGARLVIFTSDSNQMKGYWLNHYFPQMLRDSMRQMQGPEVLTEALHKSGFRILETEKYFVRPDLADLFMYAGKHEPGLYFDSRVRQGISSFSALANAAEVETGLQRLKEDMDSGEIDAVIKSYENDWGDYLFVVGQAR